MSIDISLDDALDEVVTKQPREVVFDGVELERIVKTVRIANFLMGKNEEGIPWEEVHAKKRALEK